MKLLVALAMLLLALAAPVWADITMPPNTRTFQPDDDSNDYLQIGMTFRGVPNGDIIVLVYRKIWSYRPDTRVDFELLAGHDPNLRMKVYANEVTSVHTGAETCELTEHLGQAIIPPYTNLRTGPYNRFFWCIDAYRWRSHEHHNGAWRFGAEMCADFTYSGTTTHLMNYWYNTDFYPENSMSNMAIDPHTPSVINLQDPSAGVQFSFMATDVLPWGINTADIRIFSLETGNLVRSFSSGLLYAEPDYETKICGVQWDGKTNSGEPAAPGLYAFDVKLHHKENAWEFPNATGQWPYWINWEFGSGSCGSQFSNSAEDSDFRTSSMVIEPVSVQKITNPNPPALSGWTPFLFSYNLTGGLPYETGVVVYDHDFIELAHGTGSGSAGSYSARVDINPNKEGDYNYVIWATDADRNNKSHSYKPALERGGKFFSAAPSNVICVNGQDGDDTNNGYGWSSAKKTMQAAIDAAAASSTRNEIWVAKGEYHECIIIDKSVSLYGGFAGGETTRSARNWSLNETVIDGDYNECQGVVYTYNVTSNSSVIDGFTICHSAANSAGIFCDASGWLTLSHNIIRDCSGVGIYLDHAVGGPIKIANNLIVGNAGDAVAATEGSAVLINNTIVNNTGSGVRMGFLDLTLANNIIAYNDGIAVNSGCSNLIALNNDIYGNSSGGDVLDPGDANIIDEPAFANRATRDYHLAVDSPCIDAGDNASVSVDQDGDCNPRFTDGNGDGTATVDIGAYELNCAHVVDVTSPIVNKTYGLGETIDLQVKFSDPVTVAGDPRLVLRVGSQDVIAFYNAAESTESVLWFDYTVKKGDVSPHLDYVGKNSLLLDNGTIRNSAGDYVTLALPAPGAPHSLGANTSIAINAGIPFVDQVSSTNDDGAYGVGAVIGIQVEFNEPVAVNGTPQMILETGSVDRVATYVTGSGSRVLSFTYTVQNEDASADLDYISPDALLLNNGAITDSAGDIDADPALPAPGWSNSLSANKNILIDGVLPKVMNVSSTTANGTYGDGVSIDVQVEFNEVVAVTGSPTLTLNARSGGAIASYVSGNGSSALHFNYTVVTGDNSAHLDYVDSTSLALSAGTIKDAGGNAAILLLPSPGTTGSLGANKNIVVRTMQGASNVYYVKPDGDDNNYGFSWATAKKTVGSALAQAVSGDEVWVAGDAEHPYNECVTLNPGVKLYGGFSGTETANTQRKPSEHITILDGAGNDGSVITVLARSDPDTEISGFTIRNGIGTLIDEQRFGGGIYCPLSSPVISNNTIITNGTAAGVPYVGAGIYCSESSAQIINNLIASNGTPSTDVTGGGIYLINSDSAKVINNTVCDNAGVGIYCQGGGAKIVNNISAYNGGGIYHASTDIGIVLLDNRFWSNSGGSYQGGGAPGTGDAEENPSFVSRTPPYDYHLDISSLYIDKGLDTEVDPAWLDIDGHPRMKKINIESTSSVDIGADECYPAPSVIEVTSSSTNGVYTAVAGQNLVSVQVKFSGPVTVTGTPKLILATGGAGRQVDYTSGSGTDTLTFNYIVQNGENTSDLDYINTSALVMGSGGSISGQNVLGSFGSNAASVSNGTLAVDLTLPVPTQPNSLSANKDIVVRTAAGPSNVIYVKPNGDDNNTGFSWDAAKRTIARALSEYRPNYEIWVAGDAGHPYNENITLQSGVKLYGGFAGTETSKSQRKPTSNVTIIDGAGLNNSVVTVAQNAASSTEINGFTIRNGKGTDVGGVRYGGGIYCLNEASPIISCNTIVGNCTINGVQYIGSSPGYNYKGAGIYCAHGSAKIVNNFIVGNGFYGYNGATDLYWGKGGGIYLEGTPYDDGLNRAAAAIANNTIARNIANETPGIYCDGGWARIGNNIIIANLTSGSNRSISDIYGVNGFGADPYNVSASGNCTSGYISPSSLEYNGEYFGLSDIKFVCGDPLTRSFAQPTFGMDFHLAAGSKCIDYGDDYYSDYYTGPNDPDGESRTINDPTRGKNALYPDWRPWTDIGADEYATAPKVISVKANSGQTPDGVYTLQQYINIIVEFDQNVMATGNPELKLALFGNGRTAAFNYYADGSSYGKKLNFYYQVQPGDNSLQLEYMSISALTGLIAGYPSGTPANLTLPIPYSPKSLSGNSNIIVKTKSDADFYGSRIYVKPDGDNTLDGKGWATAVRTVQAGLNAANSSGEVWVAGNSSFAYNQCITLKSGVKLYGGFAGTEGVVSARKPAYNTTILDGSNGNKSVVSVPAGAVSGTEISGFTIRNGIGVLADTNNDSRCGGGISCVGGFASPYTYVTISNNVITNNSAGIGGGIYVSHSADATIQDNLITNNAASYSSISSGPTGNGGGIYTAYSGVWTRIYNNTIRCNTSTYNGSGIYLNGGASYVNNNIVAYNTGASGVYQYDLNAGFSFYNNLFYSNGGTNITPVPPSQRSAGNRYNENPRFMGDTNHLASDSPCINNGYGSYAGTRTDMDDEARVNGTTIDIGADEYYSTTPLSNKRFYVVSGGTGAQTGADWNNAYASIQTAMSNANFSDEIWVKNGIYSECIELKPGIKLYGGFAGGESNLYQRRPWKNATILDGAAGNTSVVKVLSNATPQDTIIDGFIIQNGKGVLSGDTRYGGGIYCSGTSPTISNNIITGNGTVDSSVLYYRGTGIYLLNSGAYVVNNILNLNGNNLSGVLGAAIYSLNASGAKIINNTACNNGSWAIILSGGTATFANNLIAYNNRGLDAQGTITKRNNCLWSNDAANTPDTGSNVLADPRITRSISPYDYHLLVGSPCIDNGSDSDADDNWLDIDSQSRKNPIPGVGTAIVDIGADEYVPGPTVVNVTSSNADGVYGLNADIDISVQFSEAVTVMNNPTLQLAVGGTGRSVKCVSGDRTDTLTFRYRVSSGDNSYDLDYVDSNALDSAGIIRSLNDIPVNRMLPAPGASGSLSANKNIVVRTTASPCNVYYVTPQGSNTAVGSSWTTPLKTVQAALNAAASGNQIWVKTGSYNECITLRDGVKLYGGFAGNETQLDKRKPAVNTTTLDGNGLDTSVVTVPAAAGLSTEINGFAITNGAGKLDQGIRYGGAIYCGSCSPTISNNKITANGNVTGATYKGVGIYCTQSGAKIINNLVVANKKVSSEGISCANGASALIVNNTVADNTGTGIYCAGGTTTVANNIVAFNSAGIDHLATDANVLLFNNCVSNNGNNYPHAGAGSGDKASDPQFNDLAAGDYHIKMSPLPSPCCDAGDDTKADWTWFDIDSEPRFSGNHVDIGADEYWDPAGLACTVDGPASPVKTKSISLKITFNTPVTGLTASQIDVTGGIKGALTPVGSPVNGSYYSSYNLPVTATPPSGLFGVDVTCKVRANAAKDAAGRNNAASNLFTVTYMQKPWDDGATKADYTGTVKLGWVSLSSFYKADLEYSQDGTNWFTHNLFLLDKSATTNYRVWSMGTYGVKHFRIRTRQSSSDQVGTVWDELKVTLPRSDNLGSYPYTDFFIGQSDDNYTPKY